MKQGPLSPWLRRVRCAMDASTDVALEGPARVEVAVEGPPPSRRLGQEASLLKTFGVYFTANATVSLVHYLVPQVMVLFLPVSEVGRLSLFLVIANFLFCIVGFGTGALASKVKVDLGPEPFARMMSNCLLIFAISLLLLGIGNEAFGRHGLGLDLPSWVAHLALVHAAMRYLMTLRATLWQMEGAHRAYFWWQILQAALTAGAASAVFALRPSWASLALSLTLVQVPFGAWAIVSMFREGSLRIALDGEMIRLALRYGLPVVLHAAGAWGLSMADRVIIKRLLDFESVGYYAIAFQTGMAMSLIQTALNQAYVPWLYQKLRDGSPLALRKVVRSVYRTSLGLLVLALGVGLCGIPLVRWGLRVDHPGLGGIILLTALGFGFDGMYKLVSNLIFYSGRTLALSFITLGVFSLKLVLTFWFVGRWGILGAAYSTLLAFILFWAVTWLVSQRVLPLPWFGGGTR